MFDENIGAEQIIEPGRTICVGAKWLGDKKVMFVSDWEDGREAMLATLHAMIEEADAVVTYNGDKFDLPTLNGEFMQEQMTPMAPAASIDVYKTVRTFKLHIHKLGYVGPLLQIGKKVAHEGFGLWLAVMRGDNKARGRMKRYCIQDVRLLEKLYLRVRPFIKNHPHLGDQTPGACPSCGSTHVHSKGFRRTRCFRVQRFQCQDCGGWHLGKRTKILG
jgi:uncharacterized protein YprB with RNaseH-like and TPR domain